MAYESIFTGAEIDGAIGKVDPIEAKQDLLLSLTALTGGAATALDGQATVSLSAGSRAIVVLTEQLYIFQLKAGTDAESSPLIIRPDDYATTTNEKVWALLALVVDGVVVSAGNVKIGSTTDPSSLDKGLVLGTGTAATGAVAAGDAALWFDGSDLLIRIGSTTYTLTKAPSAAALYSGTGSPEGVVTAAVGSIYTDTAAGDQYVKMTGSGNTGWI